MALRLAQLRAAKQRFDQNNQIQIPKIQRVPTFLRQNDRFVRYCTPKIISFGPIHHGSESLKEGELYKLLWTLKFIEEYGEKIGRVADQACQNLLKKIEDNIEELKNMFTEDAIEGYDDNELAWMLFVDGCSLLHFMENFDDQYPEALNLKFDQLMHMVRDVILLENQLPSKMLEILCKEKGVDLDHYFSNFYTLGRSKRRGELALGTHILDSLRSTHLDSNNEGDNQTETQSDQNEDNHSRWNTYKSIRDLKNAGIRVMANKTDEWNWSNISFTSKWSSGELRLPIFLFNDVTPYFLRNLIAYEMCPDVRYNYECCSFFAFMDLLQSDEELANLFNELGVDLPTKIYGNVLYTKAVAFSKKYIRVRSQIEKHYANKWKTWLAQAYNTHFNTPWAMIAFLAASLALVLTFIQTWFTIHPN